MYRNILLCYDGTEEGRNALTEGADVALAMKARTHLLAILRSTGVDLALESPGVALLFDDHQGAMRVLQEGVDWLKSRHIDAEGQLVFGDPASHIATCARALGSDLIVVGHHHRSRLARWWGEADDALLLESAPCSILVVIAGAPAKP